MNNYDYVSDNSENGPVPADIRVEGWDCGNFCGPVHVELADDSTTDITSEASNSSVLQMGESVNAFRACRPGTSNKAILIDVKLSWFGADMFDKRALFAHATRDFAATYGGVGANVPRVVRVYVDLVYARCIVAARLQDE